jgi:hypothetical protein
MHRVFLKPKLLGARFAEHTLPLEVVEDWAAFEVLVKAVAKHLYLKDNPGKKNAPSGFNDEFSLHLAGLEEGSTIPVLENVCTAANQRFQSFFDRSLIVILAAIAAVGMGQPLPQEFPKSCLPLFNKFGSALAEDESIEFSRGGGAVPVPYNRTIQRELVLRGASSYQDTVDLRGWVVALNAEKGLFTVKLIRGGEYECLYPEDSAENLFDCLKEYQKSKSQGTKVGVRCTAELDRHKQIVKIISTQRIDILDANDVASRCEELALLKDGWLDGEGKALHKDGLKWFTGMWTAARTESIPLPYIYPSLEGGIRLEWTKGTWELSAVVDLDSRLASLVAVDAGTSEYVEDEADLKEPSGLDKLVAFIADNLSKSA